MSEINVSELDAVEVGPHIVLLPRVSRREVRASWTWRDALLLRWGVRKP